MQNPLVSIILPTHGRPKQLETALQSALAQSYRNIEVIVIDDNPAGTPARDETEVLMAGYGQDARVRYIQRTCNGGGSRARNSGISAARGSIITFLDDDDVYSEIKVERQLTHLQAERLDVSLCDMHVHVRGFPVESAECRARGTELAEFIVRGSTYTPMIMARKEILQAVGGFHPTPRFQDHILMIKLLEINARTGILHERLAIHNRHNGSRISYTDRCGEGFRIRHEFERRNLCRLSSAQRREVLFRQALNTAKYIRVCQGLIPSLHHLVKAASMTRNLHNFFSLAKGAMRILVAPPKHL